MPELGTAYLVDDAAAKDCRRKVAPREQTDAADGRAVAIDDVFDASASLARDRAIQGWLSTTGPACDCIAGD